MNRLIIHFLFFAGLTAISCSNPGQDTAGYTKSVFAVNPAFTAADDEIRYPGIVTGTRETKISFKTSGQIKEIHVKEGEKVACGQLLATLDDTDYILGLHAAETQYNQLKNEFERIEFLYRRNSVSLNEYEKAKAGMEQLRLQLETNRNKVLYTKLYSPVSGHIVRVNFEPSEMVNAGTPVFSVLDLNMEVSVDIPAKEYVERPAMSSLFCRSTLTGDSDIPLKWITAVPKADANQLYHMQLAFMETPPSVITPGMNVMVIVRTHQDSTYCRIPLHAVFGRDGKSYVWIIGNDGKVRSQEVCFTGIEDGMAIISEGLNPDMMVVRAGANALHEGETVRIIPESEESNIGGLL